MKDFAGNELEIGQRVIFLKTGASNSWMIWGTVIGFTPKKVRLKYVRADYVNTSGKHIVVEDTTLRDPDAVVVPATSKPKMTSEEYLRSYDD